MTTVIIIIVNVMFKTSPKCQFGAVSFSFDPSTSSSPSTSHHFHSCLGLQHLTQFVKIEASEIYN